jgi:glycosyltransferase involved in cell wall biosynthesis
MKILYLGNKLSSGNVNKTTIETLSQRLVGIGYNIVSSSSKSNKVARLVDMLFTLHKNRDAQYLLLDTYSTSAFWFALICSQFARIYKLKYIPILHGGNLPDRLQKSPFLSKLIFKNAYKNVAPSNYLFTSFIQKAFHNTILIPNAIDVDIYNYRKREEYLPRILWVRAFSEIYRPELAIKIFKILSEKYPHAKLTMVGPVKDGSFEKCKTLAHKLNIEFTGKLSLEEWIQLAENHDIFLNTSAVDNTPISLIEAATLGLPIVSSNVGGIPYLFTNGDSALLIDSNKEEDYVLAIQKIITNKNLANNLVLNARNLVTNFDWEILKNQWLNLLKKA